MQSYTMNSEQQKNSSHIIIMDGKQLKSLRQKLKTVNDTLNYQKFLYKTERKRIVKQEIQQKIDKYQQKKDELESQITEHPVQVERVEKRKKKKIDKLLEQESHKFEGIEYECVKLKSAFRGFSQTFMVRKQSKNNDHDIILYDDAYMNYDVKTEKETITADAMVILNDTIKIRQQLIEEQLDNHKGLIINEKIYCIFRKYYDGEFYFSSKKLPNDSANKQATAKIYNKSKINDVLNKNNEILLEAIETFIECGSNWQLYAIKGVEIDIDVFRPLGGSSYVELPDFIKNKKCCINVKNKDDKCFARSIQSFLEHESIKDHHDRESSYNKENLQKLINILIKSGVTFHFAPQDDILRKIEKKLDVSINIYTL